MADNSAIYTTITTALDDLQTAASGYADDAITAASGWATWNEDELSGSPPTILPYTSAAVGLDTTMPTFGGVGTGPEEYVSAFLGYLDPVLRAIIGGDSYFVDSTIQDALFDKTRLKDLQALTDATDQATRQFSAQRGFPIPNSILSNNVAELTKKYQDNVDARNSEIMTLIAERLHDARKHAIDAGIKMEDVLATAHNALITYYNSTVDALVRTYLADVSAAVDELKARVAVAAQIDEIAKTNASIDMHSSKMLTDTIVAKLQADVEVTKVNAQSNGEYLKARVDAAKSATAAMAELFKGTAGMLTGIDLNDKTGTA